MKHNAIVPGLNGTSDPPDSHTTQVKSNLTDPSLPAPDPNRHAATDPFVLAPDVNLFPTEPIVLETQRVPRKESGPNAINTSEYIAPVAPPAETEHATFELETVRVMEAVLEAKERQKLHPRGHGLRQADIPTAPSTRIQRQRSWVIGAVLIGLGVAAGLGLLALADLARDEPLPSGSSSVAVPPIAHPLKGVPRTPASPAATQTASGARASAGGERGEVPDSDVKSPRADTAPSKTFDSRRRTTSTATRGATSTVPLGPPEF